MGGPSSGEVTLIAAQHGASAPASGAERERPSIVACFSFGMLSLLLLPLSYFWPREGGWWSMEITLAIALASFGMHLAVGQRRLNAFDPSIWFPISMLLFYFGVPIASALSPGPYHYSWWNLGLPPQLDRALIVSLMAFVAFLLGFHIVGIKNMSNRPRFEPKSDRALLYAGLCLLAGGIAMNMLGILIAGPSLIFGAYGEMRKAGFHAVYDSRLIGIGFLFAAGGVYAVLASFDRRQLWALVLSGLGGAYISLFLLLTGDRGGLSAFVVAAGWVWVTRIRGLRKRWIVPALLATIIVMPMFKEYRQYRSTDESRAMSVRDLVTAGFTEMGNAIGALTYSLEYIPSDKGYDYGLSYVQGLLGAVPNPSPARGKPLLQLNPLKHAPGHWLTATVDPIQYAAHGPNRGFSYVAEWYFNFGLPGVLLGMILTGYVISRIRNQAAASGMVLATSALVLGMSLLLVRNHFGYPLKTALWPFTGMLVLRGIFRLFGVPSRALGPVPSPRRDLVGHVSDWRT
jgi:oligosaccharide repeat unit polymerase